MTITPSMQLLDGTLFWHPRVAAAVAAAVATADDA